MVDACKGFIRPFRRRGTAQEVCYVYHPRCSYMLPRWVQTMDSVDDGCLYRAFAWTMCTASTYTPHWSGMKPVSSEFVEKLCTIHGARLVTSRRYVMSPRCHLRKSPECLRLLVAMMDVRVVSYPSRHSCRGQTS